MLSQDWLEGKGFSMWWKVFLAIGALTILVALIGGAISGDENVGASLFAGGI